MRYRTTRGSFVALWMVLMLMGVAGGWAEEGGSAMPTVWFGTEIVIEPDADGEGLWNCRALLTDLGSGEVLSAPTIVFAAGEGATVQSGLSDDTVWELRVEVDESGGTASWSSRVTSGEQVLAESAGSVQLTRE